jgi:hypothetical protein
LASQLNETIFASAIGFGRAERSFTGPNYIATRASEWVYEWMHHPGKTETGFPEAYK